MANAHIILTDPALSVEMKIAAPDGLLPQLAQWIIDTHQCDPITGVKIGWKTETITFDEVSGQDENGADIVVTKSTEVTNPLPLVEVYNKLFGQMYYGWVGKMIKAQAEAAAKVKADEERAKYAVPDYSKI